MKNETRRPLGTIFLTASDHISSNHSLRPFIESFYHLVGNIISAHLIEHNGIVDDSMVATIGVVLLQELLHRVNQLQVELLLLVEEILTQLSLQVLQILLLTDESVLFLLQACLLALGAFAAEESVTLQFLLE